MCEELKRIGEDADWTIHSEDNTLLIEKDRILTTAAPPDIPFIKSVIYFRSLG
jgi:hypothetical protein